MNITQDTNIVCIIMAVYVYLCGLGAPVCVRALCACIYIHIDLYTCEATVYVYCIV